MITHRIGYRETDARLTCAERHINLAWDTIQHCHEELRAYLRKDRAFANSFAPVDCLAGAPRIALHMAAAARRAQTGPMAAVAGAIGWSVVRNLVRDGARHVVFENGGDITMYLERAVTIGIYTGTGGPQGLGLRLEPQGKITACCTSSGIVGHSFSYGRGNAAVVLADDPALADATATALGNRLRRGGARSLAAALNRTPCRGVRAMLAFMDGKVAFQGTLPPWVHGLTFTPATSGEVNHESA